MKIFFLASLILSIVAPSSEAKLHDDAEATSQIAAEESGEGPTATVAVLTDKDKKPICYLNATESSIPKYRRGEASTGEIEVGFEGLRVCNSKEASIIHQIADNSYEKGAQVAGIPVILGYIAGCTMAAHSSFPLAVGYLGLPTMVFPLKSHMVVQHATLAVAATVCLPVTAVNYGIILLEMQYGR